MADTLDGLMKLTLGWKWSNELHFEQDRPGTVDDEGTYTASQIITDGTAAGQAIKVFYDDAVTAESPAGKTYDLTALLYAYPLFGVNHSPSLTSIRAIVILNTGIVETPTRGVGRILWDASATNACLTPFGAAHAATGGLTIMPGGLLVLTAWGGTAGFAVTAGTGDIISILDLDTPGKTIPFEILIMGV